MRKKKRKKQDKRIKQIWKKLNNQNWEKKSRINNGRDWVNQLYLIMPLAVCNELISCIKHLHNKFFILGKILTRAESS